MRHASRFRHDSTVILTGRRKPARLLEPRRVIEMIRSHPPLSIGQPLGQAPPPHRLQPADMGLDKFGRGARVGGAMKGAAQFPAPAIR
jgi:hypothetical protein